MASAYEIAKAGGEGANLLKQLGRLGRLQLLRSRQSLLQRAIEHDEKIRDPARFVPDWAQRPTAYQDGLLAKWSGEAQNFRRQADIIEGYLNEHGS